MILLGPGFVGAKFRQLHIPQPALPTTYRPQIEEESFDDSNGAELLASLKQSEGQTRRK